MRKGLLFSVLGAASLLLLFQNCAGGFQSSDFSMPSVSTSPTDPVLASAAPKAPSMSPESGSGLRVAIGTEISITSLGATTIRYTLDNREPTCSSGLVYSENQKPVITTTNTTIKAIGCNSKGASLVSPRWYFTSVPHSTIFDFNAVRSGVGHDGGGFKFDSYAEPAPSNAIYVGGKAEFEQALATVKDGQTIVVRNGTYDLGRQDVQRSTDSGSVTIRAQTPGCYDGTRGVTLTGATRFWFWTNRWRLEGFCFDGLVNSNQMSSNIPFSNAVMIKADDVTIAQNIFQNIGDGKNWAVVIQIGGGTNLKSERKPILRDVVTRNLFRGIRGAGVDLPQPSSVYTGPYVWANYPEITNNTFQDQPASKIKSGDLDNALNKAIHLGTGWDFSSSFNDNQYARISGNFFDRWDGGSAELICLKSSGNTVTNNLINESYGGFSIRRGNNNVVKGNYVINNNPSCLATRVSGYGNVIENNAFDLHPLCIAWGWTAKTLEDGAFAGMTISTYPAKKNYFRWNKVKNAQWIAWVMKGNLLWENTPLTTDELPADNELRLNDFYDMPNTQLFHNDLPAESGISENTIRALNTIGSDNQFH